ncbi:MAG: hypothetical protein ACI9VN_001522 [Patescibacteria group bacterium]
MFVRTKLFFEFVALATGEQKAEVLARISI